MCPVKRPQYPSPRLCAVCLDIYRIVSTRQVGDSCGGGPSSVIIPATLPDPDTRGQCCSSS